LQPEAPVISKRARKRVSAPPPAQADIAEQTTNRNRPITAPQMTRQLPAETRTQTAVEEREPGAISSVLDKVGGAIEGIFNRVSSRGSAKVTSIDPAAEENRSSYYMPTPEPRTTPIVDDSNTAGVKKGSNGQIKPLISRDDTLE